MTAFLIDIGAVPDCHCNDAIEGMFKALAIDPGGDDATIWEPHPNVMIRGLVEEMTVRFQTILLNMQAAFDRMLFGGSGGPLQKGGPADVFLAKAEPASEPWQRWTPEDVDEITARLHNTPASELSVDDWLLGAEAVVQRYLPDGVIKTQAEYMTVQSVLLGRIQANLAKQEAERLARLHSNLPGRLEDVPHQALTLVERQTIQFASARAAIHIGSVTDAARSRMKTIIIDKIEAQVLGEPKGTAQDLRQQLFDEFGQLNRDFRRIAVTEAGEACNQGFVAGMQPGVTIRRQEAYKGACEFCRTINGKTFVVVAANEPHKDGETQVWVGKTNVGRSASPRKRVGKVLMEREQVERWWPAAGVMHPHCRGSWIRASTMPEGVDPAFEAWAQAYMDEKLPGTRPGPPQQL